MDLAGAARELFRTVNLVLERVWGGQTSAQARLERDAEEAKQKKWKALAALQLAQQRGDQDAIHQYLSAASQWDARLRQLLAEARDTFDR